MPAVTPDLGGEVVRVHGAVRPGTSLPDYARELVRTHHAVIGGERAAPPVRPRAVVARSWSRVMRLGLDPDDKNIRDPLNADELARRRHGSPLREVIDELGQLIGSVADASHMLLVVTDADGVILWRHGSSAVRRRADDLGFCEGTTWTEARVGTNAIGTALAEAAPVELFSAEHFEQAQHPWYCSAFPVHDPRTAELLGIIDVSGPALTLHPAVGALVNTGTRLAESRLWQRHQRRLERLRQSAAPLLATSSEPLLLVDDHGWVAHSSGVAATERVAVPAEGRALAVPGLGVCVPERLPDGWLVRPSTRARPMMLDLDLADAPVLQVRSGDARWRCALTTRHAEILLLLHAAGPDGLSAQALSRALYGDAEHVVTVRAEVSRLRRSLGAFVESQPYRLARGVRMGLRQELSACRFVRESATPGIRALAARPGAEP
ncbi:GAF domain-containing protein [Actinomadura sp. NPDC047616]|uniref:helix-turn-helix domain-containing protein n=1 Tax=Actinomadura sp. NPDC047616 TaxID=3155914 RepID=UPI0033EFB83F